MMVRRRYTAWGDGLDGGLGTELLSGTALLLMAFLLVACGNEGRSPPGSYTVGGTLDGLFGSGLVLENNGGDDLSLTADGRFTFSTSIASGMSYSVTIKAQPTAPTQVCTVANATGIIGAGSATNVAVSCGAIALLAGVLGGRGSVDGIGASARFFGPEGVAIDAMDNVYVADSENHTIRKITRVGVVSTLAGTAGQFGSMDGVGSAARFTYPHGVAADSIGNVYVADIQNAIRKITPDGVVSTFAGTAAELGSVDGSGSAARFNSPYGIATDSMDNVYVADTENHTIRKITPDGVVTTVAGRPGAQGDVLGPLPGSLNSPGYLTVLPGARVKLVVTDISESGAILEIMLP